MKPSVPKTVTLTVTGLGTDTDIVHVILSRINSRRSRQLLSVFTQPTLSSGDHTMSRV